MPSDRVFHLEAQVGIVMEESEGMPIGAVKLEKVKSNAVLKKKHGGLQLWS